MLFQVMYDIGYLKMEDQDAEENIRTEDRPRDRRMENTA
jgi:hypothetical protein